MPTIIAQTERTYPTSAASSGVWPVWRDSTTRPVAFTPLPKKVCGRLFQKARAYDRATTKPGSGKHGGALGRVALDVLQVMLFDFLDFTTGRLDPSHAAIARKAGCCVTAVKNALKKLKGLGFLTWQRRAQPAEDDRGGFLLRQETNAYAIQPTTNWHGWREPPPPEPWELGSFPRLFGLSEAAALASEGACVREQTLALETDPDDPLAAVLARLGRALIPQKR